MKSETRFIEAKHRHVFIFSLIIFSFMLSCNFYSNISNGLVMNGTATITYYNTKTCTNEGTAVLTVNPDKSFILVANGPSVDDNCLQSGDRTNATFYGTVDTSVFDMYITSCMLDHQPVGEADGWITAVDAGGAAICYSVKPNGTRGSKYYYVFFDVKK
jgi:hypothetical protein